MIMIRLTPAQREAASKAFTKYFMQNYPPNTIISNPHWHASKIFRAALFVIEFASGKPSGSAPDTEGNTK